ncbi:LysR family transcriptional regulator [Paracoccus seriniphilus]|uniref:Transcriptional regulator, LysR family n=1 Tax=Paracoccus seriniphilus TaxID=184748 RepID=A0A239PSW8_9RHOB|nr:LysR family transcriptional regulator [Paracoccus seriniphilus]WCR14170.1 LysR family transcriptional regulator [Paracoccus seriniphilus]SNT73143.1 transcriptional regulator, LysR family [Paracoccus seriniphilus]
MNNISWRGIRAFILVAEHGSFTAAAGVSRYSKANLSQLVSDLELSLGVQLLVRTTRRLRLTEVGEGYFRQCKQAMLQLDAASDWARQSTRTLKGDIRMNSVGGLIGEDLVAPLIMEFQEEHPEVSVRLDFSSPRVDLIEQHYDLVVRMGDLPDSSLMVRGLHRIRTRYVASPAFLAKHGPIVRPADLEAVPLIYGSVEQWLLKRGHQRHVVQVNRGLNIASGRVMLRAARSGLGVARLADIYCQADLATGALVEVLPDWSEETQLSLVCPPLRHQLARVRALMSMISDNFGSRYLSALRGF